MTQGIHGALATALGPGNMAMWHSADAVALRDVFTGASLQNASLTG